MLKSVNQIITDRCNSRCEMCSIWKIKDKSYEMTPQEFSELYSRPEFRGLEDLCISGGQPTLRKDMLEVTDSIIGHLKNLRTLFLSTNGSNPQIARDFVQRYATRVEEVYVCPSLEGDRQVHSFIRGVDTYNNALQTAKMIKALELPKSYVVFSMTIVPENCNEESLDHVRNIAKTLDCSFSFRPAGQNETFYHNNGYTNFMINAEQLRFLKEYIRANNISDRFLDMLGDYLEGKETIMGSRKNGIKCHAGDISVLIKPNGDIYPCINSSRIIGNRNEGIISKNYMLGDKELCPCCTECQIYPMLNFSRYANEKE